MKIARAPCSRASRMSASTRSNPRRWKLRPRIAMIEQKLQSNVHPRDVSTTSIGLPRSVKPSRTRAERRGSFSVSSSRRRVGRGALWRKRAAGRPPFEGAGKATPSR